MWMTIPASFFAFAEDTAPPPINVEAPPPSPKIVSPSLESARSPKTEYSLNEPIIYEVKVRWPETPEQVRMGSPEMELDNLELIGVGAETASDAESTSVFDQLLTLRFKALHPGEAKINSLTLTWSQNDGLSTSRLKIPAQEFKIVNQKSYLFWLVLIFPLAGLALGGIYFKSKSSQKKNQAEANISLEELIQRKLKNVKSSWDQNQNHQVFLIEITKNLQDYLSQKLSWNQGQEDYNAFQIKAEKLWDKKEAKELRELLQNLEFKRYSGSELRADELSSLFQFVYSFVEHKKMV